MRIKILSAAILALVIAFTACQKDDPVIEPCNPCVNEDLIDAPYDPQPYQLELPDWFPAPALPEDNPLTVEGIALGRHLFYDPILSSDSTQSCSSCHNPQLSFTDGNKVSTGILGIDGRRSSMAIVNMAFNTKGFFWDGRAATLEAQALLPVEDHTELNDSWENVVKKLARHKDYPAMFRQAFGIEKKSEITKELAVKAIAQFERTMVSYQSRFDKVVWEQQGWPTDAEQRGRDLFFVEFATNTQDHPGCSHCHGSALFTENNYFNNGIDSVATLSDFKDYGLGEVSGNIYDNGKFRVPTLRNIALTAPYMHDGRFNTLEEVLDHYASGGHGVSNEDANIQPFTLNEQQKQDLIAFLNMLTDTSFVNNPAFQSPF
ncbi:MAG: cytochrome C peroxidase [Phaeodactylibacter sp.]|nr:cytochrome C peroxidase [Phaeodactylibacter sp.]MCB9266568.1 cytochrome C peroxidase [Lewinellaceae bacterium]MCB9288642.1 cytochrome C peroxidase [Lewinellaceae bacterium]